MKELMLQMNHFFSQIWSKLWPVKAPVSVAIGFYSNYLGGDWLLLIIFFAMITADLIFGTWLAIRRRGFDPNLFGRWVVKTLTHFAVIVIVGLAAKSILGPLQINFPLLDFFLGLLICTETLSILRNLRRLGLPVPRAAAIILTDVQHKAEQRAADFFSRPENDRRRPRLEVEKTLSTAYED